MSSTDENKNHAKTEETSTDMEKKQEYLKKDDVAEDIVQKGESEQTKKLYEKAAKIEKKAEEILKPSYRWLIIKKDIDYDEVLDIYKDALIIYKGLNDKKKMYDCYMKMTQVIQKLPKDERWELGSIYANAAKCVEEMKGDLEKITDLYFKACEESEASGINHMAAKYMNKIAEIYKEDRDYPSSIEARRRAADLYGQEGMIAQKTSLLLEIFNANIHLEKYKEALSAFKEISLQLDDVNLFIHQKDLFACSLCAFIIFTKDKTEQNREDLVFFIQKLSDDSIERSIMDTLYLALMDPDKYETLGLDYLVNKYRDITVRVYYIDILLEKAELSVNPQENIF